MQGFDRELNIVYLGDTAELTAYIHDAEDNPISDATAVEFLIERPDDTRATQAGTIQSDGGGYLAFQDTDAEGEYRVIARFTLPGGVTKSTRSDFMVADPLAAQTPSTVGSIEAAVWEKFEDLFDSEDGGPWLRDMTMRVFSPQKISDFIQDAIFEINNYNPPTAFTEDFFYVRTLDDQGNVTEVRENQNTNILILGTELAIIRHLMRSYTEQPLPTGGQITYEDRRDYLQRWGTIYQIEWQRFDALLKLWKRRFLDLNKGKVLVANKAGRLLPAGFRARYVGRGYGY